MKYFLASLALFSILPFSAIAATPVVTDTTALVSGNTAFALDLYARLREKEGNLFFSPESISTALAMLYAGAENNTAKQMAKTLHFALPQSKLHPAMHTLLDRLNTQEAKSGNELAVANAIWVEKSFSLQDSFVTLIKKNYNGSLGNVDFKHAAEAARTTINNWVEEHTAHKITDLIAKGLLSSSTKLVLTNTVYFKGDWLKQFSKENTENASFYNANNQSTDVPFMYEKGDFKGYEGDTFKLLELPYQGNGLSMIMVLPKEVNGLPALENSLTAHTLAEWMRQLSLQEDARIYIPRFKLEKELELGDVLASMGMQDMFSANADFSGIALPAANNGNGLTVSEIIHKAYLDVNEQGTVAAAATAIAAPTGAAYREKESFTFRADHPFLFLLRDNASGSILFMGRLINPS